MDIVLAEMGLWDLFQQACDTSGVTKQLAGQSTASLHMIAEGGASVPGANSSLAFIEAMNARAETLRLASKNTAITSLMYGTFAQETRAQQSVVEAAMNVTEARLVNVDTTLQTRNGTLYNGVLALQNKTIAFEEEIRLMYKRARDRFEMNVNNATKEKQAALDARSKPHKNTFLMALHGLHVVVAFMLTFCVMFLFKSVNSPNARPGTGFQAVPRFDTHV